MESQVIGIGSVAEELIVRNGVTEAVEFHFLCSQRCCPWPQKTKAKKQVVHYQSDVCLRKLRSKLKLSPVSFLGFASADGWEITVHSVKELQKFSTGASKGCSLSFSDQR